MPSMHSSLPNPQASLSLTTASTMRLGSFLSSYALGTTTISAVSSMTRSSGRGSLTTWTPPATVPTESIPEDAVVRRPVSSLTSVPKKSMTLPPSAVRIETGPSEPIMYGVVNEDSPRVYSQTLPLWDLATMSNMSTTTYTRVITVAMAPLRTTTAEPR